MHTARRSVAAPSRQAPPPGVRLYSTLPTVLIGLWTLGMVGLPIGLWTLGPAMLPWMVSLNVLLLAVASVFLLVQQGGGSALRTIGTVLAGSWLIEYIGSTTGLPFGAYRYTALLQPQLGDVPLLIPLAWLMMLPAAWTIGALLAPHSRLAHGIISAAAMTAWDLFLDPQMVAWGAWGWESPGGYFGIPWLNFAGWFLSAALLTWLARPPALPILPLLWVYTLTWALQSIGLALFWNMIGPALAGCAVMGAFVYLAWRRYWKMTADR
ncbi:MAG TPA: carotenoid biosynthesis protein [Caldilineaceae bacterium]|nr:carotenoid biosynthesis protein [Caldilineaceae bacterium]